MSVSKLIVLTGCSQGLGRALVPEFIKLGHRVAGCARNLEAMAELAEQYPDATLFRALDVCDESAVGAWIDQVHAELGVPDLLINNAAMINQPACLWEVSRHEFQQLVDVNVVAVHTMIRCVVPAMIRQGSGTIVNLSSGWGRSVAADVAPYCATKWAIEGMTKALSQELPAGLSAVPLSPGVIDTAMLRDVWGDAAGGFSDPQTWAAQAAPFILSLGPEHNGQSLTAPGG